MTCHAFRRLCENYMSSFRTHPCLPARQAQPLFLKREGAKTSSFLSFLKVPFLVREGFRVSLLLFTQSLKVVAIQNQIVVNKIIKKKMGF